MLPVALACACDANETSDFPDGGVRGGVSDASRPEDARTDDAASPKDASTAPPLVLDSASTRILLPAAPSPMESRAASLLQAQLRRVYAAPTSFAIVNEVAGSPAFAGTTLAVGRTAYATGLAVGTIGRDGFRLVRTEKTIAFVAGEKDKDLRAFAGQTDRGVYYAVVRFLDRYAGVRFYLPGERFTSSPSTVPLSIPAIDETSEPFMRSLFFSGISKADEVEWAFRNAVSDRRTGDTHQHTMYSVFPPSKYMALYPKIYPVRGGSPYTPTGAADQSWQPCFSEPDTLTAAVQSTKEYFTTHPEMEYVAISVNDSRSKCERDPQTQPGYAEAYWTFMNKVAAALDATPALAGKRVLGLAYADVARTPNFTLNPRIIVVTNVHVAENETESQKSERDPSKLFLDDWYAHASHFGNHDWAHGLGFVIPRVYSGFAKNAAVRYRNAMLTGKDPSYAHVETYPHWALDGPKLFVVGRLAWDPMADQEAILDVFAKDMFGSASTEMAAYFRKLEALWTALDVTDGPERKLNAWGTQLGTLPKHKTMIAEARGHLDAALAKLPLASMEHDRVKFFSDGFRLSELLFQLRESWASNTPNKSSATAAQTYANDLLAREPLSMFRMTEVSNAIAALTVP